MRYVDDFGRVEPGSHSKSGFQAFTDLSEILGLRMKPNKAQPPSIQQELLGVEIAVKGKEIQLKPTPTRKDIHRIQAQGTMSPVEASRLAGRMNFLGKVGGGPPTHLHTGQGHGRPSQRRCLRHHTIVGSGPADDDSHTGPGRNQRIPARPPQYCTAILCADAFFQKGETWHTADTAWEVIGAKQFYDRSPPARHSFTFSRSTLRSSWWRHWPLSYPKNGSVSSTTRQGAQP